MDGDPGHLHRSLIDKLSHKATLNQQVFDNTFTVFGKLKETLHELSSELDEILEEEDQEIRVEYRDRGKFEAQLQVADDILLFSMHSNVFEFNREHILWQNPYVQQNRENALCGIIQIYNFLSDSFKYNRTADEGYLIGRIFINREKQYFVEGKRQTSLRHDCFGTHVMDKEALLAIVERAISYSLDFNLLVPPYDTVKVVSVDQLNTKFENSKMPTGKRHGYPFNSDDI
ncbi:MAG: hypothetical protein PHV49_00165 [Alistipes sp.]|nr:hypothetical protein [Alistipes sp.]